MRGSATFLFPSRALSRIRTCSSLRLYLEPYDCPSDRYDHGIADTLHRRAARAEHFDSNVLESPAVAQLAPRRWRCRARRDAWNSCSRRDCRARFGPPGEGHRASHRSAVAGNGETHFLTGNDTAESPSSVSAENRHTVDVRDAISSAQPRTVRGTTFRYH